MRYEGRESVTDRMQEVLPNGVVGEGGGQAEHEPEQEQDSRRTDGLLPIEGHEDRDEGESHEFDDWCVVLDGESLSAISRSGHCFHRLETRDEDEEDGEQDLHAGYQSPGHATGGFEDRGSDVVHFERREDPYEGTWDPDEDRFLETGSRVRRRRLPGQGLVLWIMKMSEHEEQVIAVRLHQS